MGKYLVEPGEVTGANQVGSKGWFLVRGIYAGFTIPETVFVTARAFHDFIKETGLQVQIKELQEILNQQAPREQWEPLATKIRTLFEQAEALPQLRQELVKYVEANQWIREHPLAVRSSGVKEDNVDHSFAGQYETVLNVSPEIDQILKAVHRVWASEWNWQNIYYHQKKGLPLSRIGMGVILQRMVNPQYAGVVFTMNPTGSEKKEMVIEYVEGLGEALVSGQKTPERILIDRSTLQPREGKKTPLLEAYPELLRYFRNIEEVFEMYVDVEWAIEHHQLFILQIRPITKIQSLSGVSYLWTDENVGEVIPDVVTPLSWSILNPMVNGGFVFFISRSGLPVDPQLRLFDLYKNKVYFNNTLFNEVLQNFYLTPSGEAAEPRNRFMRFFHVLPRLGWIAYRLLRLIRTLPKEIYDAERKYRESHQQQLQVDAHSPPREHLNHIQTILKSHNYLMGLHISCTILGELFYQILDKLAHAWMAEGNVVGAEALLQGIGEAESIRSGIVLRQFAEEITRYPQVRDAFLTASLDTLEQALTRVPQGKTFWQKWQQYLREFGHGSLHEFELYYPRWAEDPEYIFNTLRQYLSMESLPPLVTFNKKERQQKVHLAESQLLPPLVFMKRLLFGWVRRKAEFFTTHRENLKQILVREHFRLKQHLMAIAAFFVENQWLNEAQDIFFLTLEEIEQLIQRGKLLSGHPRALVAKRREERELYLKFDHPSKVRQVGDQWIPEVDTTARSSGSLTGIGCSNGVVEGPARVVLSEADFPSVQQGEILVTIATNPGWTPLFVLVKGVVTEIGGALSHGAIIAREFGIPMVAGVTDATKKIKNGDWIRVNGTLGKIEIIKQKAEIRNG